VLGLLAVGACAACASDDRVNVASGAALTAGSVTNPTGSWSGGSLAGLRDAYTGNWSGFEDPFGPGPTQAQWQHLTVLSNQAGACGREGTANRWGPSEITLRFLFVGTVAVPGHADTYPPAADLPLTFQGNGAWLVTSDGVTRHAAAYAMKAKSSGVARSDRLASSGTVTFTRMDSVQYEGSYSLNFGSGAVTGSFVAPWCGTAP
jgi:hypothetical protein